MKSRGQGGVSAELGTARGVFTISVPRASAGSCSQSSLEGGAWWWEAGLQGSGRGPAGSALRDSWRLGQRRPGSRLVCTRSRHVSALTEPVLTSASPLGASCAHLSAPSWACRPCRPFTLRVPPRPGLSAVPGLGASARRDPGRLLPTLPTPGSFLRPPQTQQVPWIGTPTPRPLWQRLATPVQGWMPRAVSAPSSGSAPPPAPPLLRLHPLLRLRPLLRFPAGTTFSSLAWPRVPCRPCQALAADGEGTGVGEAEHLRRMRVWSS